MCPCSPAKRSEHIRKELDNIIEPLPKDKIIEVAPLCKQLSSRRRCVDTRMVTRFLDERDDMEFVEEGRWIKL